MPWAPARAVLAAVLGAAPGGAGLVPTPDGGAAVDPVRAERPPVLDGQLDDAAWTGAPLDLPDWLTYNPVNRLPRVLRAGPRHRLTTRRGLFVKLSYAKRF